MLLLKQQELRNELFVVELQNLMILMLLLRTGKDNRGLGEELARLSNRNSRKPWID